METSEDLDKKTIQNLATLLRKNGDKILSGESKFCLTTGSIVTLNASFHRCSSLNLESEEQPKEQAWREDVHLLFDFVRKTVALKVIHGTYTIRAPIQISRFRNLRSLEVKKVPIHMLEGLQILRGQLVTLTISKSLQTLKDLFEVCGGDRSSGMSWECLKVAFLSFNNIIKVDESLYLTDTRRINLGYNCLTSVPTFSYTVKSQLKTLILRSNNLDDLAGVEELSSLEELDVADNLLSDHSCLKAITKLHRLYIICLQGNPIFFHNNHRSLALQYISASCDLVKMALNGQRLSATEMMLINQRYKGRLSDDNFIVITVEDVDGRSTNSSQGNVSPSKSHSSQRNREKKKGHIRRRSRDNIIISDLDTSATEYSSSLGSRTSSPTGSLMEGIGTDDILEEKKRIEILRKHYGDDWLRAFSAEKYGLPKRQVETNDRNNLNQSDIPRDVENENLKIIEVPRKTKDMQTKASDVPGITQDIQTKIPDVNRTFDGTLYQDHANKREVKKVDVESHQGESSDSRHHEEVQKSNFLTDIYASADTINTWDSTEEPSVRKVLTKQETLAGFEWTRTPSQQEELYGEESEPFIVMLPDNKLETIIVTLNDRYIIEKKVDLTVSEKLDVKSLQNYRRVDHVAKNQNVEVDITLPTIHLKFDSVNKRKRERFYAMEDNTYAEQFMAMLTERLHKLKVESDTESKLLYECYICSYQFYNDEPSFKAKESKPQKCPKCMGKMIFKVSTKDVPDGAFLPATVTQKIASPSVIQKKTQLLKKEPDQLTPPVLRRQKNIKKKRHEECEQDSVMEDDINTQHPSHPATNLVGRGEQPSSDSGKSAQNSQKSNLGLDINRPAVSTFQTSRNSVSSVESDIMVINTSNKGDVETISEVIDVCTLNEKAEDETVFRSFFKKESGQLPDIMISLKDDTSHSPTKTAILRGSSGSNVIPGETTPIGSPLSSSICSSMVSSVYEKTLPINKSSPTEEGLGVDPSPVSSDDLLTLQKSSSESPENRYRDSEDEHIQRWESNRRGTYINRRCATMIDIDFDLQKLNLDEDQGQRQDQAAGKKYQDSMPGSLYCEKNGKDIKGHNDSGTVYFTANNTPIKSDSRQKPVVSIYGSSGLISQKDIVDENDSSILVTTDVPALQRDKKMDSAFKMHGMYTKQTDEYNVASKEVKNNKNGTGYSKSLESAQSSKGDKSVGANNSVDYSYFTNIDHNLQLYLELKLFDGEEKCQGVLECDIVQYMNPDEFLGLMVLTSSRILIYRVIGDRNSCDLDVDSDWLTCIDNQPITELRYIDIGLGYQSLRLEFGTECSSFTFIIRDEKRCQNFLSFFTGIVQSSTFSEHSMLQGITKNNPTTMANLQEYVLQLLEEGEDVVEGGEGKHGATLVKYLTLCFQEDKDTADDTDNMKKVIRSIVITYSHICLVKQNYQWPLPRLQAPLDSSLMGKEFELQQKERINNIESFEVNEEDPTEIRISFFNEDSEAKVRWIISIATLDGVQSLVSAIKDPWEQEFGVSLDVTEVTFQED
ncbi:hypothetical protein CHS0354_016581 [Potamilus streckersoni]|uniref:Serine/threonine-protein kinase 11-interacting protein n=1 Tax=Potamilus streckersoni TaxID=2493646 RepID=A0AAE0WED7_9BIVA|nr:hypothetical protein CHS0354_016581 [Potamilus streckersoni]